MPKMELIIKKIFGKLSNDIEGIDAIMKVSVIKGLLFITEIYKEKQLNKKIKFFYYYKGEQTCPNIFPNVSVFESFVEVKNFFCDKNFCFCCGVYENVVYFNDRNNRCIWGSLVTFVIKMNFID